MLFGFLLVAFVQNTRRKKLSDKQDWQIIHGGTKRGSESPTSQMRGKRLLLFIVNVATNIRRCCRRLLRVLKRISTGPTKQSDPLESLWVRKSQKRVLLVSQWCLLGYTYRGIFENWDFFLRIKLKNIYLYTGLQFSCRIRASCSGSLC